ncbi:MAG TPA: ABC transporter ATP-binding protein [Candidatus Limnocylindrales bacterium]|nr:ABC transporter ATP-binding protein [Candidatus Limnocylindrales bacterium]
MTADSLDAQGQAAQGSPVPVPVAKPGCGNEDERPKSLRLLPRITADAVRMVWAAAPRLLVASIVLKLVNGAGIAVALIFSKNLIGSVLTAGTAPATTGIGAVAPQLAAVVGVITVMGLLTALGREVREVLSETTSRKTKQQIIDIASTVELSAYETPAFHDRLQRVTSNPHRPLQLVDGLIGTIGALASIGGIVVALLAIQPWLIPLLFLAGLPLLAGVAKAGQAMFGFQMRMTSVLRARNYLFSLLTGKDPAKEVRAFGLGAYLAQRHTVLYDLHMSELRKTTRKRFRIAVLSTFGLAAALGLGITGLLALALSGRLQLAETATAAGALLLLGERIMYTVNSIGEMYESGLYVEDFTDFLATAPQTHGATGTRPAPDTFDRISVQNVTFTYPAASTPALVDVSLDIEAGQVIALVGENGSGKTTLAKLLSRLYLPQQGRISWDGHNLAELDPAGVHRRVALIFQDFARYQLSARENIGLGAIEHLTDQERIRAAAIHAGADLYLSALPDGYDTVLSAEYEGGRDLSVGQWQRVALARAFIRDAPLIILDEPTASLDPRAEHDLFTRMRSLYAGRTVLLISHRFNTVRDADHIYVLHAGQIIEHGTHDQLIAAAGTYAELFTLQAKAYTDIGPEVDGNPNGHHDIGTPIPPARTTTSTRQGSVS